MAYEIATGQWMRFNGTALDGSISGSFTVQVLDPHSNAQQVTHTDKAGREYEGAFSHVRSVKVERPAFRALSGREYPVRQFDVHSFTLEA